ncbi:MAG: LamG domain-containing protein [Bryobacteraceae bacterium]|nr:LamG domain-containing protein [Bryobacteraceae bacterium]
MKNILAVFLLTAPVFAADTKALKQALTFHAPFDGGTDAAFGQGDKRIHTAPSYKEQAAAKVGLDHPDIELARGKGRFGDALLFKQKNVKAVFYAADRNVAFSSSGWTGTISFWLSLNPDEDLAPGFCDPIQVTDDAYNDSAIWVDFTKDDKPRHFRLGVFGDLKSWNPANTPSDKSPDFNNRLVVTKRPPFARGKWTHVAITHAGLGGGNGMAKLYLNGELIGTASGIKETFHWEASRAAIRLGVNYVGLFDELAVFSRELSGAEVKALYGLKKGVSGLR